MDDPEVERGTAAPGPVQLGELVGAQSVLLMRVVALLAPGLAAAVSADLLEQVWADYLSSLFEPGAGAPVATGLLTVLVGRCRGLADPSAADRPAADPPPGGRFRPDDDRWAGAWRVGRGPRQWRDDPRLPEWTRAAVEALPLPLREVLVLRDTAGLDAVGVGAVLQLPEAEVRSLLHRARTAVWMELERLHAAAGLLEPAGEDGGAPRSPGPAESADPYPGDAGHRVTCCQLVELLTHYLEGALEAPLAADLEAHLAVCPECRLFVRQVAAATTQAGRLEAVHTLPPALVETVLRRLNGVLQARRR